MAGDAGLCGVCVWADPVRSARGSVFLRCRRSEAEPERFAKYPRLPRLECEGFEAVLKVEPNVEPKVDSWTSH